MPTLSDAFNKLIADSGLSDAKFSKRCGVKQPNVSLYKKKLGPRALLRACENYYGWPVIPLREIEEFDGDCSQLPTAGGIYVFYDSAGNVVYLGKATNLKTEVKQTYKRTSSFPTRFGPDLKKTKHTFGAVTKFLSLYQIDNPRIRKNFEAFLLRVVPNQTHNHNLGQFS
jgi:hypothetical protein